MFVWYFYLNIFISTNISKLFRPERHRASVSANGPSAVTSVRASLHRHDLSFSVNSKLRSSFIWTFDFLLWLLRLFSEQTQIWASCGSPSARARSNHCERSMVSGSPLSLCRVDHRRRVCARFVLAAVLERRRHRRGCLSERDLSLNQSYFPLQHTFVDQMEMYRWVLFMFDCTTLFLPPPSCLCTVL